MSNIKPGIRTSLVRWLCGLTVLSLVIVALPGCGGGEEKAEPKTAAESKTKKKAASKTGSKSSATPEESGVGWVSGTVKFAGTAPELKALVEKGADVRDAMVCSAEPIPDQSLEVNSENSGVANVFVFLARAPKGGKSEAPAEPAVIDQKGCQFFPHGLTVQVGQNLKAISSDPVPHNIHTFPIRNSSVNSIVKPNDKEGITIDLGRPETQPFQVKCDIHPWMSAYVLALDHPYMAITDENGKFEIKDLPVGTHTLKIWHEKAGYLDKEYEVVVKKDQPTEINEEYPSDKFAAKEIPGLKTITLSSLR